MVIRSACARSLPNSPSLNWTITLSLRDALPISDGNCNFQPNVFLAFSFLTRVEREGQEQDRKSTRLNSSHVAISYAVFCLKKKKLMRRFEDRSRFATAALAAPRSEEHQSERPSP